MRWIWAFWLATVVSLAADNTAADLAARLREAPLNPDECYRIREISLFKEDLRLYFTEGFIIFSKPVDGRIYSAAFSGEMEGGDAEILVMPPDRSERLSLATFTDSPNLSEHFRFALMVFSDDTAETLARIIHEQPRVRKSPERGVLLADRYNQVMSNFSRSFGTRLVYDVLSAHDANDGFFYAAIRGKTYGNFDVVYDPTAPDQLQVGQVRFRNNRAFFNVWTNFQTRSFRNGTRQPVRRGFRLRDYRIEATLEPDLKLRATTDATLAVSGKRRRVFFFDISPNVEVTEVTIDGQRCEIWQRNALRANLFGGGTGLFIVVTPEYLAPGPHSIHFGHEGRVVREAGNGVYYVGSRNSWYPDHGLEFSHFDVTFRYPEGLDLVFAGEVVEDRSEGEWHITRRRTKEPVRLIGFNVGRYEHVKTERESFAIEVYANKNLEAALEPERKIVFVPKRGPDFQNRRRGAAPTLVPVPQPPVIPDPTEQLEPLAEEVAEAFQFMQRHFGPPPTSTLMVSPIPGSFGQGFPGLLYLSTMSYLKPEDRPEKSRDLYQDFFYSEILHAHETAHQWWGNTVTTEFYQDAWLMEALANYSALLLLEKEKGTEALEAVLGEYRNHLLRKNEDGKTLESAGPIIWGPRLNSSQARAFRIITYEKGSWVMHMLRKRLGDANFLKMLGEICREHRYQSLTTDDFRKHASAYVPEGMPDRTLEHFFDQWVYDVGIPTLEFSQRIRGSGKRVRVTARLSQSGVPDYFSTLAPVEIQFAGGKTVTRWLVTGEEAATLDLTFPERPVRVVFDPGESVLAIRK